MASSLYASGTNLSRSVSSVGERQSEAYVSPTLPKRAETFGGFDNNQVPGNKFGAILKKHKDNASGPSGIDNVDANTKIEMVSNIKRISVNVLISLVNAYASFLIFQS